MSRVKLTETFVSIQGEADAVGWPTLFIRLTGCPLRCVYCDTQYAFYGGDWRTVPELLEVARGSGVRHVCVTGGEPPEAWLLCVRGESFELGEALTAAASRHAEAAWAALLYFVRAASVSRD